MMRSVELQAPAFVVILLAISSVLLFQATQAAPTDPLPSSSLSSNSTFTTSSIVPSTTGPAPDRFSTISTPNTTNPDVLLSIINSTLAASNISLPTNQTIITTEDPPTTNQVTSLGSFLWRPDISREDNGAFVADCISLISRLPNDIMSPDWQSFYMSRSIFYVAAWDTHYHTNYRLPVKFRTGFCSLRVSLDRYEDKWAWNLVKSNFEALIRDCYLRKKWSCTLAGGAQGRVILRVKRYEVAASRLLSTVS